MHCSDAALYYLRLSLIRGIGPHIGRKLVAVANGVERLWNEIDTWKNAEGITERLFSAVQRSDGREAEQVAQRCAELGIQIVCPEDACYPPLLAQIEDAPLVLFVLGECETLKQQRMLSVVGARKAVKESRLLTRRWCRALAQQGVCIVSGMAYGIDAAAHGGALDGEGLTIAVIGSGLAAKFTHEQQRQIDAICERGCVVSEFLPGAEAKPEHFPRRNRIIAGMSQATLVMEAAVKSGSLITARQALEYGREVFAVPGSVLNGAHSGCHQLVRDGAGLVESAADILGMLGWKSAKAGCSSNKHYAPASPQEEKIVAALRQQVMHIDRLAEHTGLTLPELSPILLALELLGAVQRLPGSRYMLGDAG